MKNDTTKKRSIKNEEEEWLWSRRVKEMWLGRSWGKMEEREDKIWGKRQGSRNTWGGKEFDGETRMWKKRTGRCLAWQEVKTVRTLMVEEGGGEHMKHTRKKWWIGRKEGTITAKTQRWQRSRRRVREETKAGNWSGWTQKEKRHKLHPDTLN